MEISELLVRELKDPRIGLTTVTEVKMSPDLKQARVYVSVLGGTEERQKL
jgi:ribosome-binding factor A